VYLKVASSAVLSVFLLSGCSSVASSSASYVNEEQRARGAIYMTSHAIPDNVGYQVIGKIKANARIGYDDVSSLYPLLSEEARKVGANAVINVKGGRTVSAFSWAAPKVSGTAVKIDDVNKLSPYGGKVF